MKMLGLPEVDLEAKQPVGVCKARCKALHSLCHDGDEDSVVREEKVTHLPLEGLGVGLEAL